MLGIGNLGRINMRGRLMILITAAMAPLGVFLLVSIASDYASTLNEARREMMQAATLAATRQSQIFATSRIVLDTVRRSVGVSNVSTGDCRQTLAKVKNANPQFLSVGVTNDQGLILCHSSMQFQDTFRDQRFIRRILDPQDADFVVSDLLVMRALNRPTVTVGLPILDDAGNRTGVVFAGLDLAYLASKAGGLAEGGRYVVAIFQPSSGQVLTSFPSVGAESGSRLADHPLVAAMRSAPFGGVTEAPGFTGEERVFGFAPIEGAETSGLMLVVGESRDALLQPVRRSAIGWASAGTATFLTAVAVVWWLGKHLQLRPVARLTHIAARIGAGDFDVRTHLEPWQSPELRGLALALDRMAGRLAAGRKAEKAVAASEAQYRLLAENTADMVTSVDADGVRQFASPSSIDVIGYPPEELVGLKFRNIIHPDDQDTVDAMLAKLGRGERAMGVRYRMRHRDGRDIWVEVNGRPTEGGQAVFAIRDITMRKEMEDALATANRQLAALASTDGLTGLLNRRSFDVFLTDAVASGQRSGGEVSLLMIDVDRFKGFNDRYGHQAGDECLRQVASTLRSVLRRPGIAVARYGGEEFAVILPDTPLSAALQEAEALRFGVLNLRIRNEASEFGTVSISVGIASQTIGADGQVGASDFLHRADRALYVAKKAGRNRSEIGFDPATAAAS